MSAEVACEACGTRYLTYCHECAFRDAIRQAVDDESGYLMMDRMLTLATLEIVKP